MKKHRINESGEELAFYQGVSERVKTRLYDTFSQAEDAMMKLMHKKYGKGSIHFAVIMR